MRLSSVLITVLVSSFSLSVFAQTRCPDRSRCPDVYSRAEAYKDLSRRENSNSDARENLNIVVEASENYGISLKDATDSFIKIQGVLGGSSATENTQEAFRSIVPYVGRSRMMKYAKNFSKMARSENGASDTMDNFSLVMEASANYMMPIGTVTDSFITVLRANGGSSSTSSSQRAFRLISREFSRYSPMQLAENYRMVADRENGTDDAYQNFKLIIKASRVCNSIDEATDVFLDILSESGGSSSTSSAQSVFKDIYGI